jgi:hypothetical protein
MENSSSGGRCNAWGAFANLQELSHGDDDSTLAPERISSVRCEKVVDDEDVADTPGFTARMALVCLVEDIHLRLRDGRSIAERRVEREPVVSI